MLSVWEGPSHSETHPASGIYVSSGQEGTQATKTIANQSKPEDRRPWHYISCREGDRYTSCPLYLITTRDNSYPFTPIRIRRSASAFYHQSLIGFLVAVSSVYLL